MQLKTTIEYHTVWGEEIVLRSGGKPYRMEYLGEGLWGADIDIPESSGDIEYHYELVRDGAMLRREWGSHVVHLSGNDQGKSSGAGKEKNVRDWWQDVPLDLPLQHGLFSGGRRRFAGTAIPVFSLRSEDGFGTGEFLDLKKMVDWAEITGQSVIQLLPVNDTTMTGTWRDSYPYNANSTFALHPQYMHLPSAGVKVDEEYKALQKELNTLPYVDYERVNREKARLLKKAFEKNWGEVSSSAGYQGFIEENSTWLFPYAAYRILTERFGTPEFRKWGNYAVYDAAKVECFCRNNQSDVDFHCFVQYHLHIQLLEIREYAHGHGVILKGDLPIGISRTSVDAWLYPELFHLDSQAGAPPDAFAADGQNWGFPTYDWDRMEEDGYAWWKARLGKMSEYFEAFRIDHILGFFRIWEIPLPCRSGLMGHFSPALPYSSAELRDMGFGDFLVSGVRATVPGYDERTADGVTGELLDVSADAISCDNLDRVENSLAGAMPDDDCLFIEDHRRKGYWHPRICAQSTHRYAAMDSWHRDAYDRLYEDFFYHRHNSFWKESALRKLSDLLASTGMIACGEDLGMIPGCVPETMQELQILSLEIQRMPKSMGVTFADPAAYPYYSVCTTSTHDMNPLRAWWEEDRALTMRFFNEVLGFEGEAPLTCEPWVCRQIVEQHLNSPAMFTVLPLQDWLSTDGLLRAEDPAAERINVPANPRHYWRYRMHLTLESLVAQAGFNGMLRGMVAASGRS
ncbi:MAG: 4-alpha-glucanotransferase [Bacteroidales bacterium]|nr:4-alpha-glucanotransferase [Bacteroidales bacterium]